MLESSVRVADRVRSLLESCDESELRKRLAPKEKRPQAKPSRPSALTMEAVARRWSMLAATPETRAEIADALTMAQMGAWKRNIENFIGTVKVPVGIAGPLRVNGVAAQGAFYVPLATTEAALVASFSRGASLITAAGGCSAAVVSESIARSPGFAFDSLVQAGEFVIWVLAHKNEIREAAETTTAHGKLFDITVTIEGNHVYLGFLYTTGDAAGQNMVTIATDAACRVIVARSPIKPRRYFLEANMSGDKKATALSLHSARGRRVTAEVKIPNRLIMRYLHTSPSAMLDFWRMSALGGVMSGTIGVQGQFANGLAALYIATGQDAACVAESAVGITRFEATDDDCLYATVTLPNIIVGSVGGGTALPSQRACLSLLGAAGPGKAAALAELCAALCLAGELSLIGALAAGQFCSAHQHLARNRD